MGWNLLGHEWAEKLLQKHIVNGDVRHAYLFTGAPGIGRRSLALAFASAINCTQPPAVGQFCGVCRVCKQTAKMVQPDLSIVEADVEGGMIKVDQVRGLQRSLSLSPYEAKYRIALLLDFQRANANAQNALLKTLEEAPTKVILLVTADSAENLLPTISSRCEILRLRPVSIETLEKELPARWEVSSENARTYAHLSNGRTGMALKMAQDADQFKKREGWVDELLRLLPLNRRERFAAAESLSRNRGQVRLMLQVWLGFARDLLLMASDMPGKVSNIDRAAEISELAKQLGVSRAFKMVNHLAESLETLEANANLRLLLDNLLLDLPRTT